MPPSVFQLQHVQHIQKAFYVCPSLSVAVVGLGVPVLQPPPCGGGIRSRAIFSGDIRATLPFFRSSFGVRGGYPLLVRSLFVHSLAALSRVRCDFLVVPSLFVKALQLVGPPPPCGSKKR